MKKMYYFSLLLGLVLGSLTLTACGDDDDDNVPGTEDVAENPLVGKWTQFTEGEPYFVNDILGTMTVTHTRSYEFKKDMTFEFLGSDITSYEKVNKPAETRSRSTGTYTYKDNVLTLTYTWTGFWDWYEEKWQSQGNAEAFTSEFVVTFGDNSISIAPKNNPDAAETYTK